jgi:hypothetical protein
MDGPGAGHDGILFSALKAVAEAAPAVPAVHRWRMPDFFFEGLALVIRSWRSA